jgi:hypothetical protein
MITERTWLDDLATLIMTRMKRPAKIEIEVSNPKPRREKMTRSQIAQLAAIRAHITINQRKAKKARNFKAKSVYLAKAQALQATYEALTA